MATLFYECTKCGSYYRDEERSSLKKDTIIRSGKCPRCRAGYNDDNSTNTSDGGYCLIIFLSLSTIPISGLIYLLIKAIV